MAGPLSANEGPFTNAATITPNDTTDLAGGPTKGIWVGGAGTVNVDLIGGSQPTVSFTCVAGQLLPVRAKRVRATGTSATLLVALY